MGAAIIPNLIKAGHQVGAWNRNADALIALQGVEVLPSPAAAFQRDAVITMLANDEAVRSVIIDSGALTSAHSNCVHVMRATISPALVEELHALHGDAGIAYVSAPVFGLPAAAAKAELNIVAAGDAKARETVQPIR